MMMDPSSMTLYALFLLIINGGIQWIRELKRGNNKEGNGKMLKEIKENIGEFNDKIEQVENAVRKSIVKIAEINTAIKAQKTQCKQTVDRFDKTISDQNEHIIELAGRKR